MPVTADSFLWEATGFFSSAGSQTVDVTHPDAGGTTAGSVVVVALCMGSSPTVTVPAGFEFLSSGAIQSWAKVDVSAAETSWSFTVGASTGTWYMVELSNDVAVEAPFDGSGLSSGTPANGGTVSSGTTALNAGSSGVALAFFNAVKAGTTDVQSWSGYTNSFVERVDVSPASGSVAGRTLGVAWKVYGGWSTYETTATFATTAASAAASTRILLLRSADASINAPLSYFTGFGFGTHAGMGASSAGSVASALSPLAVGTSHRTGGNLAAFPVGTWGTQYSVGVYGRDGRTGLELAASAAIVNVRLVAIGGASGWAFSGNVKAVSGSGTPTAVHFVSSSQGLSLLYDVTNEKFGLEWSGGSAEWQTGTTPVGSYAWVDIKGRTNSAIWHADWSIETGTGDGSQTSPTDLTGMSTGSTVATYLGSLASQTGVFRYSDIVASSHAAAHPLGPHVVRVLVPETTGATVSGTSGNFNKFTANGTLAAWAGDAGALLDELPPTVSASSDGVVQNAVAASDYMNFPMTTYTCAPNEIIAGVRAFASLWGGTGSGTGTLGFRGDDGLTGTTFIAASASFDPDSLTTASATYPMWYAAMWSGASAGAWTQTRLDAAALRVGFSTDATPDMGVSSVGLEVAIREISNSWVVHRLTDDEDPEVNAAVVTETLHPYNSAVRTFSVSNDDPTRTAEFRFYESGGAEHADSPVVIAPTDPPIDVTVGAEAFGEIESTSFGWQP